MEVTRIGHDELRERLRASCGPLGSDWSDPGHGVPAAVLLAVVDHPDGPGIILTQRTELLQNHPGQISLPGGRIETDDPGPAEAALREAHEEIGLPPDDVELLGCLPPYHTVTDFRVYPFVGWVRHPVRFTVDEREVAAVFEVPLSFVLDPINHLKDSMVIGKVHHDFYVISYSGHRIWGATAGILISLARLLQNAEGERAGA